MFSRRHPFLFFIVTMTIIICSSSIIISFISGISGKVAKKEKGKKIGVVEINGVILDSVSIIRNLKNFRKRKDIYAVVVRINSPGGGVAPSQEISEAVRRCAAEKPVVASLGSVAASGGYYIASAADYIIANPGTITGSIGVIMEYTNIEDIMKKIGIKPVVIKSGKFKDAGSPTRPLTKEERKYLQNFVDEIHEQFVADVAKGRNLKEENIRKIADGRIISGKDAVSKGLVDKLGNYEDALDYTAEKAGIKNKNYRVVFPPKKKFSFLRTLFEESASRLTEIVFRNRSALSLK